MTITAETLAIILSLIGILGSAWRVVVLGTQLRDKLLSTDIAIKHQMELMTREMHSELEIVEARLETLTLLANGNKEAIAHTKERLLTEVKEVQTRLSQVENYLLKSTDFEK